MKSPLTSALFAVLLLGAGSNPFAQAQAAASSKIEQSFLDSVPQHHQRPSSRSALLMQNTLS